VKKRKSYTEREFGQRIRIYDNGGKTLDRYTVIFLDLEKERDGSYQARAMSENPFHGFGMWCSAFAGRHLGKRITEHELPMLCQKLLYQDLEEIAQ
jgi:hypothetical protein